MKKCASSFLANITFGLTIVALSVAVISSGCSSAKEEIIVSSPDKCFTDRSNGVYELYGFAKGCSITGTPEMLSTFIATHPTLRIVSFSQIFNMPLIIVVTEKR